MTTDELPKYDVKYAGQQQLDEINTYVFDVAPKKIEKNQRYFQGRIWVDQEDLGIIKTYGKAVPDIKKKNSEHLYPRFETFRENIEGHYWFPTYTHADDTLQFSSGGIHMRMTVRYENYKRFGSTIKIGPATEVPQRQEAIADRRRFALTRALSLSTYWRNCSHAPCAHTCQAHSNRA